MMKRLLIAVMLMSVVLTTIFSSGCVMRDGWRVTNEGLLEYRSNPECDYQLKTLETTGNHTLHEVVFTSRGKQIAGLLRTPRAGTCKVSVQFGLRKYRNRPAQSGLY